MNPFVYSAEEHQKLLDAEDKYGNAFVNAYNASMMLSNIVMWPVNACDLFIRFYSQVKKYHVLSMISTVRLHRIQAKMDLRYFLESTVHAAFTLAHTDTKNYFDFDSRQINDSKNASSKAYKWIADTYPGYSKFIKDLTDDINRLTAHAHVVNSAHNFDYVPGKEIITSYFDFEDDEWVKVDLWIGAKAGLNAIDLILAVQSDFGGFIPKTEADGLITLMADNDDVRKEIEADRGTSFDFED
jgi:hypothetical protein